MSGIELQMNLELDDMAKEGFKPEGYTIEEGPLKPSPFDAGEHLTLSSPCLILMYIVACCVTTCHPWVLSASFFGSLLPAKECLIFVQPSWILSAVRARMRLACTAPAE